MKISCGLVRATSGRAEVCGAPAGSAAARRALGYLAELFRFPGWATATELLELHQRLARSDGGAAERAELLELVGLAEARDRRIETMSKGMQQRLGIAQALVGSPRLLLLDEPTSALDPAGRRTVRALLEELRRRGVAVLLNTHLLSEVERVCDRVAIIDHGRLVAAGTPAGPGRARPSRSRPPTACGCFPAAGRDDVPGIVERLVHEGERGLRGAPRALDARGRVPRRGRAAAAARLARPRSSSPGLRRLVARASAAAGSSPWSCASRSRSAGSTGGGPQELFQDVSEFGQNEFGLDATPLAGATILGLAMFGTLFLGVVLAVFLTLGAVRGDAERGLLQPLIVRPLGRTPVPGRAVPRGGDGERGVRARRLRGRGGRHRARSATGGPRRPSAPGCASPRRSWSSRAVAARVDLPVGERERHRGADGVRRGPARRACSARSARRSSRGRCRRSPTRRRGSCRSRPCTATRCACSSPTSPA